MNPRKRAPDSAPRHAGGAERLRASPAPGDRVLGAFSDLNWDVNNMFKIPERDEFIRTELSLRVSGLGL